MKKLQVSMLTLAVLGLAASAALAQRGVGDPAGVARSGVKPEIVTLSGKVLEVKTEPCANTTGRSPLGTHFLMKTAEGKTLNIHLGPAAMVEFAAKELVQDKAVKVQAFRTEKMKEDHYVAQQLSYDGGSVTLRDETLQPVWAGGAGTGRVAAPPCSSPAAVLAPVGDAVQATAGIALAVAGVQVSAEAPVTAGAAGRPHKEPLVPVGVRTNPDCTRNVGQISQSA